MTTSRRSLFQAAGALLALPALVRIQSLMPSSPQATFNASGVLTWDQITTEAARQLRLALLARDDVIGWGQDHGWISKKQSLGYNVVFQINPVDLHCAIQQFSMRVLRPAMKALAETIPSGAQMIANAAEMRGSTQPGYDCAVIERGGVGLRAVKGYWIGTDCIMGRFDVRCRT
jgi:hypothetical protein